MPFKEPHGATSEASQRQKLTVSMHPMIIIPLLFEITRNSVLVSTHFCGTRTIPANLRYFTSKLLLHLRALPESLACSQALDNQNNLCHTVCLKRLHAQWHVITDRSLFDQVFAGNAFKFMWWNPSSAYLQHHQTVRTPVGILDCI